MAKFKFQDKIIECDYDNDVLPVILGKDTNDEKFNIKEAEEKYTDYKIFQYQTGSFDESLNFSEVIYYYIGAPLLEKKEYVPVSIYDGDMIESDLLIETILQVENYKKTIYTKVKCLKSNIYFLLNEAIDDIYNRYNKGKGKYFTIDMYDEGGWHWEYGLEKKSNIEKLISSIRIVEEVKNEEV